MTATRWLLVIVLGALVSAVSIAAVLPWSRAHRLEVRAQEARSGVRDIAHGAFLFYIHDDGCTAGLHPDCPVSRVPTKPRMYPDPIGLTPAGLPFCEDGEPIAHRVDPAVWDHPIWKTLKFAPRAPIYFHYAFASTGEGLHAQFTARAVGDLDCDGVLTTFERAEWAAVMYGEAPGPGHQTYVINPETPSRESRRR